MKQLVVVSALFLLSQSSLAGLENCKNPIEIKFQTPGDLYDSYWPSIMRFCEVPAIDGFEMGSPEKPAKRDFRRFWMLQTPVTQHQYAHFVKNYFPWKKLPFNIHEDRNAPAAFISFSDTQRFITQANAELKAGGQLIDMTLDLPTEAEWEYAARGGVPGTGKYYWGENFNEDYVFYDTNTIEDEAGTRYSKPVYLCPNLKLQAEKFGYCANQLGLMHMMGNVWQWVKDDFTNVYQASEFGWRPYLTGEQDSQKSLRGQSWWESKNDFAIYNRDGFKQDQSYAMFGFRVILRESIR